MGKVTTIGIDIAKSVFQIHGVDVDGAVVLRRRVRRKDVMRLCSDLEPCLVGMEACATAHHWARELAALGHTVRLMPAGYVKAYVKRGKHDAADAEAICEAVSRPSMREVAVKTIDQQARLTVHRARDQVVRQRTQTLNAMRAHMAEFGLIAPTGAEGFARLLDIIGDPRDERLPATARHVLATQAALIAAFNRAIATYDADIREAQASCETSRRLSSIPGVGQLTASALSATVGDAKVFKSGRSFAAWLGLTPRISGTGGKVSLGAITKKGDGYLRRLLVLGATAVLKQVRRDPACNPWAATLLNRLSYRQAAVAVANKMARIVWALMVRGGTYETHHRPGMRAPAA